MKLLWLSLFWCSLRRAEGQPEAVGDRLTGLEEPKVGLEGRWRGFWESRERHSIRLSVQVKGSAGLSSPWTRVGENVSLTSSDFGGY